MLSALYMLQYMAQIVLFSVTAYYTLSLSSNMKIKKNHDMPITDMNYYSFASLTSHKYIILVLCSIPLW